MPYYILSVYTNLLIYKLELLAVFDEEIGNFVLSRFKAVHFVSNKVLRNDKRPAFHVAC